MVTKETIQLVRNQIKPLVDAGLIPSDEFRELLTLSKQSTAGECRGNRKPEACSRKEAAERLGVSLRTLDRLIFEGDIQARRIGKRRVSILMEDIIDYLNLNIIKHGE